jgi:hypothetical protein
VIAVRRRLTSSLAVLAAIAAPAAIAACGSGGGGQSTTTITGANPPTAITGGAGATGHEMTQTIPAQIDEHPDGLFSSDALQPLVNAWRVSSPQRLTEVDAGALPGDQSTGALGIFRQDYVRALQEPDFLTVEGSGPLRITKAPLGKGVETSAQEDGEIEFVGAHGVHGTLHLSDDTVTVTTP